MNEPDLRRTKILATLGPATDAPGVLDDLVRAGVNVVRLNFSHGIARASRGSGLRAVRDAGARQGREVGILADLAGPEDPYREFRRREGLAQGGRFVHPGLSRRRAARR